MSDLFDDRQKPDETARRFVPPDPGRISHAHCGVRSILDRTSPFWLELAENR